MSQDTNSSRVGLVEEGAMGSGADARALPEDPTLPGLEQIRANGVARALPSLQLQGVPVEIALRGYSPGKRATLEVRAGERHLAIMTSALDLAPEVELRRALATELAGDSDVRVPPLVAWERDRRIAVFEWLDGPSVSGLVEAGHGPRVASMAARWLRRSASLVTELGDPMGGTRLMRKMRKWLVAIGVASTALVDPAEALGEALESSKPRSQPHRLMNGSIHARGMLDLGAATGMVNWKHFGQGPLELDAGLFLAAVHDLGLAGESAARATSLAERTFLDATADILDPASLAWHRAAGLLRIAYGKLHGGADQVAQAGALLREAERLVPKVGREGVARLKTHSPALRTASHAIPEDPELPGLVAIRAQGLAAVVPELKLGDGPVELTLRAHQRARRATIEVRAEGRHFALKAYAKQPTVEAALCRTLADAGLSGDAGPRVPPLLAWNPELRVLVIGWLEGPTANELLKSGLGERAGDLAGRWLERASTVSVDVGPPRGAPWMMARMRKWTAGLATFDAALGAASGALAEQLAADRLKTGTLCLVHGTFHDRNVLDLGDAPGVIDWERCGQGPLEFDAGTYLACLCQRRTVAPMAVEAARATEAFRSRLAGRVDEHALAWHESAALLCRAYRVLKSEERGGAELAHWLLDRARGALSGDPA